MASSQQIDVRGLVTGKAPHPEASVQSPHQAVREAAQHLATLVQAVGNVERFLADVADDPGIPHDVTAGARMWAATLEALAQPADEAERSLQRWFAPAFEASNATNGSER